MIRERKIQPVIDNYDKRQTYARHCATYNRAMKGAFYFEALLIDYAMLEDRLRSMIYHMAFLSTRDATQIWKKTKPVLSGIVAEYKWDDENDSLRINSIKNKIKIVRSVLLWASNTCDGYQEDNYLKALKTQCEGMDVGEFLKVLNQVTEWIDYRNEVIHSLLNKNDDSLNIEIRERAENGMKYARYLDNQLRIFKKGNKVRRSMKLSNN